MRKSPYLATRRLFGFDFISDTTFEATIDRILGPQPVDDRLPLVVTPNVDDLVRLAEPAHAELAASERRARYVLPDGQPIVWTSRLLGEPLGARLPGSTLFPLLWKRLASENRRVVVVAPSARIGWRLHREHSRARVVVPPVFDADDAVAVASVVAACASAIEAVHAEFVILGISFPKQQRVALDLVARLRQARSTMPLFLLLGGSLDLYTGGTRRAPEWMQAIGLEWFFRFLCEPRRLFRRYFVTDVRFAHLFANELQSRGTRVPTCLGRWR
jgi:N-acetylglucosaminyldiphosphoundecaprenol N-acetyl-beta-D-mannosaminyltransferase